MALSDPELRKAEIRDKAYKLSHGSYPQVTLSQARNKRDDAKALLAEGTDPSVHKRLEKIEAETQARTTFLLVAEEYLEAAYDRELADATLRKKIWHIHTLAEELL